MTGIYETFIGLCVLVLVFGVASWMARGDEK